MSRFMHGRWRCLVEKLFTGDPDPRTAAAVFAHLAVCASCARLHARYARLEATLCGSEPTRFAIDRVGAAVLGAAGRDGAPSVGRRWRRAVWAFPALAVALVWALFVLPVPDAPRAVAGDNTIVVRGAGVSPTAQIGVRVFVVESAAGVNEPRHLRLGDVVTFTYTNLDAGLDYLALAGVQAGALRWYYPDYGGGGSIPISAGRVDEPLGDGIRLSVNHFAGSLRVVAIFSAEPLDRTRIATLAQQAGAWSAGGAAPVVEPGLVVYGVDLIIWER